MRAGRTLLALALAGGGCVYGDNAGPSDPGGPMAPEGDFADGTLLRLRLTRRLSSGSIPDCGLAPDWTWRYEANAALIPDGPDPRVPPMELGYSVRDHVFTASQAVQAPLGTRTDSVWLFQGRTFSYTAFYSPGLFPQGGAACVSGWEGVVEPLAE